VCLKYLIEELFGGDVATYVGNKHRGGVNGQKGTRYEDFYAVLRVAELSSKYIEQNMDYEIEGQSLAFVDDIVISFPDLKNAEYYQLKNSNQVSWGTMELKSICDDFLKQHQLNIKMDIKSTIILVVPDERVGLRLQKSIPSQIANFSRVEIFPSVIA